MGERGAPGPEGTRGAPVSYISLYVLVFHFHFIRKCIFNFPLCPQSPNTTSYFREFISARCMHYLMMGFIIGESKWEIIR